MYNEIVAGYSPVGDIFLLALGVVCSLISRFTMIKRANSRRVFRIGLIFLLIACIANIGTYYLAINSFNAIFVVLARDIYHGCLLFLFATIEWYLIALVNYDRGDISYKTNIYICFGINVFGTVLDVISPITRWGLYCDNSGHWYDPVWFKPYTLFYIINMLMIVFVLFKHKDSIIKVVRNIILITQAIAALFVLIESINGHNSYTTLTFALPVLAVLLLLHSNPYNIESGSFGADSFNEYLQERSKRNVNDYFMFLRFYSDEEFTMPKKLGKAFYNFYIDYFKDAVLYNPTSECFVLAIKTEKNEDAETSIRTLINDVFPRYYDEFRIDYKILVFNKTHFHSVAAFQDMTQFFLEMQCKNSYRIIDEEDYKEYSYKKFVQTELLQIVNGKDLNDERVIVYVQPIMNINTGKFDTAEALMRLQLPEIGMVFPNIFIPIAEESGCIHGLTLVILNKVCKKIVDLRNDGFYIERITVNVSMSEVIMPSFVNEIKETILRYNIPFESVGIEITESKDTEDYNKILNVVNELKKLGNPIYLDDFGTGYSNFDRIIKLNVDVIKFDKSLLPLDKEHGFTKMVLHISQAFKELGCKVLYEGIETEDQKDFCISAFADYIQGYFYSKPVEIDKIESYLSKI